MDNPQTNEVQQEQEIGPASIGFTTFLLKLLSGCVGGAAGGLLILVVFLFTASFMQAQLTAEAISPIFIFLLMVMIFLGSTISNLLSVFLVSLTEREKYKRTKTALYQVFIMGVLIFLLMVPVYFITASTNIGLAAYAVALHIILSAQLSANILEIVSDYKYALVGVYGAAFSILVSAGTMFGMYAMIENPTILLFTAIPIVWVSLTVVQSITMMIYGWIARIYDKDFLATQTVYGDDYGKQVESEEEKAPRAKDEAGADFLKHN